MPLKTILVHLDTEAQAQALSKAAITVAKTFLAHVIGLHVAPNPFISASMSGEMMGELIQAQREANQASGTQIAEIFDKTVAGSGVAFEWRMFEANSEATSSVITRQGQTCDLVILGQSDNTINLIDGIGTAEDVMFGIGRPVLIIPITSLPGTIGRRILLAWNGSRESARATFDALPFLEKAESVHIFAAGQTETALWGSLGDDRAPTAELEATLKRHGVVTSVVTAKASGADVANKLLAAAKGYDCDLIVMGGYGHWRVREIVFCGATRGVLSNTTFPVLMSH